MDWEIETLGDPELLVDGDCVVLLDRDGLPDCELDAVAHCVREIVAVIEMVGVRLRSGEFVGVPETLVEEEREASTEDEAEMLCEAEEVVEVEGETEHDRKGDPVPVLDVDVH